MEEHALESLVQESASRRRVTKLMTAAIASVFLIGFSSGEDLHRFTVKDSIEMSYIIDSAPSTAIEVRGAYPQGGVTESPDGTKFFLVTQRGVLSSNCLEATIWVFDRKTVSDYVAKASTLKPVPKPIVTFSAQSNTPVISDVRWMDGSNRISFLGKNGRPYQQLFVADVNTGSASSLTKDDAYVSAYDIRGDMVAYSTLIMDASYSTFADAEVDPVSGDQVVDVAGKNLFYLLYPNRHGVEGFDESDLLFYPSALHVLKNGREVPVSFTFEGQPLRLVIPTLSISPDGLSLITVSRVNNLPANWASYKPRLETETKFNLSAEHQRDLDIFDPHRASQFVLVSIQTGVVSPLVNAPVGRCLYWYFVPTKAIWSSDSRKAILSNTFLPVDGISDESEKMRRHDAPVIAQVDTRNREIRRITTLQRPPITAKEEDIRITRIVWNEDQNEVRLTYGGRREATQGPEVEMYRLDSGVWTKTSASKADTVDDAIEFAVDQDLNHPPVLTVHERNEQMGSVIWDPNPQLQGINLGTVSLHHWQDISGHMWTGLLALPPNYDPKQRYPLLIQTYGYESHRFFTDGQFTSSYAGRAATAKGIVVLQMAGDSTHMMTPEDGPSNLRGFESAVDELSKSGLIDRTRVGIVGFSYTCFYVLYSMTHHPDLFAAASIFDGTSMSYLQNVLSTSLGNGLQDISNSENGGPPFGPTLRTWLERAPGFNLDKVRTPLRMYEFERTALLYDWEIYSGLFRLNKPVDIIWLQKENAPHILVAPHQRYLAQQGAVDWFAFWLQGTEDPEPSKTKQYGRWRLLRLLPR
jgi:dipeptidyl aminopeptidase/acylaminoacyl peptidase